MATVAVERVENVRREFDGRGILRAKTRTGAQVFSGRVWQAVEGAGKSL
ncbi:MAG: hypothetical protein KAU99_03925 [Thermoplasmata archaeon]|nr:hypothetical protein [Thermoplasmata archaeon]